MGAGPPSPFAGSGAHRMPPADVLARNAESAFDSLGRAHTTTFQSNHSGPVVPVEGPVGASRAKRACDLRNREMAESLLHWWTCRDNSAEPSSSWRLRTRAAPGD